MDEFLSSAEQGGVSRGGSWAWQEEMALRGQDRAQGLLVVCFQEAFSAAGDLWWCLWQCWCLHRLLHGRLGSSPSRQLSPVRSWGRALPFAAPCHVAWGKMTGSSRETGIKVTFMRANLRCVASARSLPRCQSSCDRQRYLQHAESLSNIPHKFWLVSTNLS